MAIHPTAATPHLGVSSGIAHGLALVSVWLLWLGALGLTLRLKAPDRLAVAALVAYGFASVAVMLAVSVSGFIVPCLLKMMAGDTPSAAPLWKIVIASIFQINQAFSKVYSVAGAVAICLWSISCLRQGRLRAIAIYGVISAPLIALLIAIGHLRLNVHGMTAVMLTQVIWFVGVGVWLSSNAGNGVPA